MTRPQKSVCPWCGYHHDLVSAITSKADRAKFTEEPRVDNSGNSVSFCIGCGESAIFDAGAPGGLRFPSFEESMAIMTLAEVQHLSLAWHKSLGKVGQSPRPIRNKPEWMQ